MFCSKALLFALLATAITLSSAAGPSSPSCKRFAYKCYAYVKSGDYSAFEKLIADAQPGDMIELAPGTYYLSDNPVSDPSVNPARGWGRRKLLEDQVDRWRATVFKKSGTSDNWITICGDGAVFDGSDKDRYKNTAFNIAYSKYVRVAGLTLTWANKGLEIIDSSNIHIYKVTVAHTLSAGVRLRLNTVDSKFHKMTVRDTGIIDAGNAEAFYVGTALESSVGDGYDEDRCNGNVFMGNKIGPKVRGDAFDIKDFSDKGVLINNYMDARDLKGENGALSAVNVKGSYWKVKNNVVKNHPLNTGAGFRAKSHPFETKDGGSYNEFSDNACENFPKGVPCIDIQDATDGNKVN